MLGWNGRDPRMTEWEQRRLDPSTYRELFNATSDALFVHDVQGRIVQVNARACVMFGFAREQLLGLSVAALSSNEDSYTQERAAEQIRRTMIDGESVFEWRCRQNGGEMFWAEIALRRFEIGALPYLMASIRDIEARKRMEAQLRQSEHRFETIFNSTSTMLAFTERTHGCIIDVNNAWLENMGMSREQALGRTGKDLGLWANPEDRQRVLAMLETAGRACDIEADLVMGGRTFPAQLSVQHVERNGDLYILWEVGDLTERKRAEAEQEQLRSQLLQVQKMESIGRLAGGIAHDFNNILSAILGFGDLALDLLQKDSTAYEFVAEMVRAGERAGELTKQLLAFSRKQVLLPRIVDPAAVMREVEPMLRRLIGEDVHLNLVLDPETSTIRVDTSRLEQVIVNLVVNARDAMPNGGTLTLETTNVEFDDSYLVTHADARTGPHVMIAVSDTGVGMDAVTRARAFEPFFTTKGPGDGTGLGLSTVYGIVKQSGGWVWLYSEPGRGTTFKLYFPHVSGSPTPLERGDVSPPASPRSDTVVLMVEDDPQVRLLVATILGGAGYTVLVAANPLEAIEMEQQYSGEIHVLLTDVVMPHMNGRQLAEKITARRPDARVVFVSGYTENTIIHRGEVDEGVNFLSKPITSNRLLRMLARVLARDR
jgi:two-component system cell cycle sensor histidine kinase/response regulator CckA